MNRQSVLCVLYRMCGEKKSESGVNGRSDRQYVLSTYCGVTLTTIVTLRLYVLTLVIVREQQHSTGFFLRFVLITFQFDRCRNLTTTTSFDLSGFHFNLYFFIVT